MTDSSHSTRVIAQPSSGKIIPTTSALPPRTSQVAALSDEIPFVPAYDLLSENSGTSKTSALSDLEIALIGTTLWYSHNPDSHTPSCENRPNSAWLISGRISGISQRL